MIGEPGEERAEQPGRDARSRLPPPTPASALSISSTNSTHGAIASAIASARRTFRSVSPTSDPISAPTSSRSVGRPTSLPIALQKALLPQPGGETSKHAPRAAAAFRAVGPECRTS